MVTSIEFVGNTKFTSAELLRVMQTRPGQVLNRNTVGSDGMAIEALYTQKGYTQTRVQDYYVEENTNKLEFVIFEPRIGEIRIDGNTKTREYVIRRQLTFHPGDVYRIDDIQQSLKNLEHLGIFEDCVGYRNRAPIPGRSSKPSM